MDFPKKVLMEKISLCWKDEADSSDSEPKTLATKPVKKVMKSFQRQIQRFALGPAKGSYLWSITLVTM